MRIFRRAILAFLMPCGLTAQAPSNVPEVTGNAVELAALRYVEMAIGTGAPALPGRRYTVHYTGWLKDGTKFDSSRDRKEPFQFVQGRKQVITGWDIGFEGMKVGGKRRLFIPYQLAYGEKGTGSIPANAELTFDVELLEIADTPDVKPAADVLVPFGDLESKVMALAKAVPETKYAWRPAPGVRTFGEVFLHIALGNQLLLNLATNEPSHDEFAKQVEENAKAEKKGASKDEILKSLTQSFAAIRKALEAARAGQLGHDMDFFGQLTTRRGIYIALDAQIAEHLGQAIAYARMNGITPPWSKAP
jgi:hypothetical protein